MPVSAPTEAVRVLLLGGFLGAGKTTMLLRLAERYAAAGLRVGLIANDQGSDLVDTARFRAAGWASAEVTGGCFCCRFDDLIARADELIAVQRPDVLLAEPVGSCTDVIATVVNPLRRRYPDRFRVSPFGVLVDPLRAMDLLDGRRSASLSEKVTYIFRMQQMEAEAIVISKLDRLSAADRSRVAALLAERFPAIPRLAVSAHSGEGLDDLAAWLDRAAAPRPAPDIDYDVYAAGEAELGWLNASAEVTAGALVALDPLALDLAGHLADVCRAADAPLAHGKVMLRAGFAAAVVSLTDVLGGPQVARRGDTRATAVELLVNLRLQAAPDRTRAVLMHALDRWSRAHGLCLRSLRLEAFSPPRPIPTNARETVLVMPADPPTLGSRAAAPQPGRT